jgi:Spy/CpxP family protein refolding chaperone
MRTKVFFALTLLSLIATACAFAQQTERPKPGADPIGNSFFSPELVMQNQEAIGLDDEQKTYLKNEIRQAQVKFTDWQWKLQDEMEKMSSVVKQPHIDEQQALAELDKVLAIEREIKRQQVTLMLRIKNKLTPDQQSKLTDLRGKQGD